jgi:hypothetical protein
MPVALTAATASQQNYFLPVFGHVTKVFPRFGVIHHRPAGNFYYFIRTVFSETTVLASRFAMTCHCVTVELQVKQCPVITITAQDDMASSSAIAPVGTSVGTIFLAPHVCRAPSALTRAAVNLYVINKIRFSHTFLIILL